MAEGWLLCSFQIVSKVRKFVIGLMGFLLDRLADDLERIALLDALGRNRAGEANRIVREAPPSPPSGGASSCGGEFIFKQVWSQIVPRHYPLSPDLRQHLQTEISAKLCSFVARGVMEPTVLLGLTVATVKSPRRKVRRRGSLATPHPVSS